MTSCPTNFIIRWCVCAVIFVLFLVLAVIFTFSAALNAMDKNTFNSFSLCYRHSSAEHVSHHRLPCLFFYFPRKFNETIFLLFSRYNRFHFAIFRHSLTHSMANDFYSSCVFLCACCLVPSIIFIFSFTFSLFSLFLFSIPCNPKICMLN